MIAARLVGLLPRCASAPPHKTLRGVGAATNLRAAISMIVVNVIFMAIFLGAQSIMASRQPPSQADKDHARVSSTVSPQLKTPRSD